MLTLGAPLADAALAAKSGENCCGIAGADFNAKAIVKGEGIVEPRNLSETNAPPLLSIGNSGLYALALSVLTVLFAVRIAGQLITLVVPVSFLPPFGGWYSGIIPYAILLPLQLLLIGLMIKISSDIYRERGYFSKLRPRTGRILRGLSCLYALLMMGRYALTMFLRPELRWFTGTTPIWFHFGLAAFLFVFGNFHASRGVASAHE